MGKMTGNIMNSVMNVIVHESFSDEKTKEILQKKKSSKLKISTTYHINIW